MAENLYLFANNNEGVAENLGSYRLYDMSVVDNGEILRDYQPVLDSNNIPCLLDKKNMKYYYNKGTGIFNTKEKVKYKKLTCIKTDGASYIDLGLKDTDIFGGNVEIKCGNLYSTYKTMALFGGSNYFVSTGDMPSLGIKSNYIISIIGFESKEALDENYVAENYTNKNINIYRGINATSTTGIDLYLGAIYNKSTETPTYGDSNKDGCPIYYFKIWDSESNLVMHLIPAISTNNEIGMYDLLSEQFFYNQGEGTFGYEIEELEVNDYTEIEYIESTGTQYIDIGVIPTTNTDIDMTCRTCDYNESPTINNSYILNGLAINNNTYQYNNTDTTVQPNLVASEGATLTMGTTNLNKLDEEDIEVATNNGWSLV